MSIARRIVLIWALALGAIFAAQTPARADDTLVSAAWLADRFGEDGLAVLDVRSQAAFEAGHIPGAISLPLHGGAWLETRYDVPGMLTPPATLARALGARGIESTTPIVVVSGSDGVTALAAGARAFWSLTALGHETVYLLDGGLGAWVALAQKTARGPGPQLPPHDYSASPDPSVIAEIRHVEDAMSEAGGVIDARDRGAFEGHTRSELVRESGTIVDAVNLPAGSVIDGTSGTFLPPDALRARAGKATSLSRYAHPVVFSDIGLRAALVWFALHEILAIDGARLYDGSLAQWTKEDYDMYDSTDGMGGVIGG